MPPPMDARPRRSPEGSAPAVADERDRPADGVLLLDKPAGLTSHDVVDAVRRSLGGTKTGHAGTLDPFATGLLLVLVGRATKAQRRLLSLRKRYEVLVAPGARPSTVDTDAEILYTGRDS